MTKGSLYNRIYSYREKESTNARENFIIEILAFCLESDTIFLDDFLDLLNISTEGDVSVTTQSSYEFGRPDIEINIPSQKICILIECKIEHFERANQLEDYKKILENKKTTSKHLVYLTKYYDFRENQNKKINLVLLRWADIFNIISETNTQIVQELKTYIKELDMSESKNFTFTDLASIRNISGTIRKMDEVLDGIRTYYEERIGILSKDSARSTRMKDEWYVTWQRFTSPLNYSFEIEFGFMWWNDEIILGTRVLIFISDKFKKTDDYLKLFKKILRNWDVEEYNNCIAIKLSKPVAQFILDEDEQIIAMVEYLKKSVDKLESLKQIESTIFN